MRSSRMHRIAPCCVLLALVLWGCAAQVTLPEPQATTAPTRETTVPTATVSTAVRRLTPVAPLTPSVPVASQTSETPAAADGPLVTILYTNDGRGKIDPCG